VQVGQVRGSAPELYDSSASRHMSPLRDCFIAYQEIPPRPITAADKRVFYAIGVGDVVIDIPNGESSTPIRLKDVLHAPDMGATIVSISRIAKASFSVCFEGQSCKIKDSHDKVIGIIPASDNGLYKVDCVYSAVTAPEHVELATMHRRLGHIAPDAIWTLFWSGTAEGVQLIDDGAPLICDSCEHAKSTWKIIRREHEETLAPSFGAEVHTNLWGPSPVVSLEGRKYYITFTDDHTCFTWLQILRTKDQALDTYKAFAAWASTQHGAQIKRLRSNRGSKYTGAEFTKYLNKQGTERQLTTHDMPQHNRVAESLNCCLVEHV
jgi:hypothetical protein